MAELSRRLFNYLSKQKSENNIYSKASRVTLVIYSACNLLICIYFAIIGTAYSNPQDCIPSFMIYLLASGYLNIAFYLITICCSKRTKLVSISLGVQFAVNIFLHLFGCITIFGHMILNWQ